MSRRNKTKTHFLENVHMPSLLEPPDKNFTFAATKVMCTLGHACQDVETLTKMLKAGMTCARVDLTWASVEYHEQSLSNLREAMQAAKKLCAIVVDTVGRELMIRRPFTLDDKGLPQLQQTAFEVKAGAEVRITVNPTVEASAEVLPINYPLFTHLVQPGDTIFIGRYLVTGGDTSSLYLQVQHADGDDVVCTATNNALLTGLLTVIHSRVHEASDQLRVVEADLPLLTQHDVEAVRQLGAKFDIDFLALTFTRSGDDVREARSFLEASGLSSTKILAKVESGSALHNFASIVAAADGVILSRGNLGLDVPPEKMAVLQKAAISQCNLLGKPLIITRIVDTMVTVPRPTRAEATDVANAVLDGVDGLLLGAETLRGKYPVITIDTIVSICRQAEAVFDNAYHFDHLMQEAMVSERFDETAEDSSLFGSAGNLNMSPADSPQATPHPSSGALDSQDELFVRSPGSLPQHSFFVGSSGSPSGQRPGLPKAPKPASTLTKQGSGAALASLAGANRGSSGSLNRVASAGSFATDGRGMRVSTGTPLMSKMESIASTAVRAAAKVKAGLIIVYTNSGRTAALVAKYRPEQPIIALVVPQLVKHEGLRWDLAGRSLARQCLIYRGIIPMLAAPMQGAPDNVLSDALGSAVRQGLVKPSQHVVCIMTYRDTVVLKIISVDSLGRGVHVHTAASTADLNHMASQPSDGLPSHPIMATNGV